MKPHSWTRAAPFKEERYYRTPSESIANNYTPTANNLKLKSLKKKRSLCKSLLSYKITGSNKLYYLLLIAPIKLSSSYPPPVKKRSAPSPPAVSLPPMPMPQGFHLEQQAGIRHSQSRPMTPGEQFDSINVHQAWEDEIAGVPSEMDVEVRTNL